MIVNFTDDELAFLRATARRFQDAKAGTGAGDMRADTTISNVDMHYIGLKAAYTVSRLLGADFDRTVYKGKGRREPSIYFGDISVATFNRQRHLVVDRTFDEDIAVLCNPAAGSLDPYVTSKSEHGFRMIFVVGYCSREDFLKWRHIRKFPSGSKWMLKTRYFKPLSELAGRHGIQIGLFAE